MSEKSKIMVQLVIESQLDSLTDFEKFSIALKLLADTDLSKLNVLQGSNLVLDIKPHKLAPLTLEEQAELCQIDSTHNLHMTEWMMKRSAELSPRRNIKS